MSAPPASRPRLLLCECAGTMASNLDFDRLEAAVPEECEVERRATWCSREGQARLLELSEQEPDRLVFAGCSQDFARRRFHRLLERGLRLEFADLREGCSWVHGDERGAVTEKALRIVQASLRYPVSQEERLVRERKVDSVLVIGGGVAGTQAAAELAQMGHRVELVERRPFLGGRAARIGTVFPTNDCGQCLPTTDAQAGVRKCFHRNIAIDDPKLRIWRRTEVESVRGKPGDFEVSLRRLPNVVTSDCVNCGLCEQACGTARTASGASNGQAKAIFSEFYDGRVLRTVDLDACSFCGACAEVCPVGAIDFTESPELTSVRAGAILTAIGCEPAPSHLVEHLGYGHGGVVTQTELAELLDDWEEQSWLGQQPARDVVMIQCAGSRDRRRLPYCSRLCCMIALKHAIRLRTLFPEMRVTICYLELRTAGVAYENWYLAARRAGVEFLRGTPPRVEFDADGSPVIEVEDMTASEKRLLRPDLVVLSTGFVPAADGERIAGVLGVELDDEGFVAILDRKNRATETRAEGVFVCGSAAGPKALVECNTEASAVASEIHNFLASAGRRAAPASTVDPARCIGCDSCRGACPFGAISLVERATGTPRPEALREQALVAAIDDEACRACGICAASCPELAIAHTLDDERLLGRLRTMVEGVERPVVGFMCRECAGAAVSLSGLRRDRYPENVRLIELPCLGRVSALHIVEAVRLGAAGIFLAGCAEERCQYRSGDLSAAEQARLAAELLEEAGTPIPLELWHLCAVDRHTVGRRIRHFCERAAGRAEPIPPALAGAAPCEGGAGCVRPGL